MARELELEPDYSPVEPGVLTTHLIPPGTTDITTSLEVTGVVTRVPYTSVDGRREYVVEVEFKPLGKGLDDESFKDYLRTYEQARITQEGVATLVHSHLLEIGICSTAFVEVSRQSPANKKVRLGQP